MFQRFRYAGDKNGQSKDTTATQSARISSDDKGHSPLLTSSNTDLENLSIDPIDPSQFIIPSDDSNPTSPYMKPENSSTFFTHENNPDLTPSLQDSSVNDIPKDIRKKLNRLNIYENMYTELLNSYRATHAKVSSIKSFETILRENTPLVTIDDCSAFLDYLSQLTTKSDLAIDELRRVSNERLNMEKQVNSLTAELENVKHTLQMQSATSPSSSIPSGNSAHELTENLSCPQLLNSDDNARSDVSDSILSHLRTEIDQRDKELLILKSEKERLESELLQVQTRIDQGTPSIDASCSGNNATEKELRSRLQTLELELQEIRQQHTIDTKRYEVACDLISTLRERLDQANKQGDKPDNVFKENKQNVSNRRKRNRKFTSGKAVSLDASPVSPSLVDEKLKSAKPSNVQDPLLEQLQSIKLDKLNVDSVAAERLEEINQLRNKLVNQEDLIEEIAGLRDELIVLGEDLISVKDELKQSIMARSSLEKKLIEMEMDKDKQANNGFEKNAELEAEEKENDRLLALVKVLEKDVESGLQKVTTQAKMIGDLTKYGEELEGELSKVKKEEQELRAANEAREARFEALEKRDKENTVKIVSLEKLVQVRDEEIAGAAEKFRKMCQDSREMERKLRNELTNINSQKARANEAQKQLTVELDALRGQIKGSGDKQEKLEIVISKLKSDNESLQQELAIKTTQFSHTQETVLNHEGEIRELFVQLNESREKYESLVEELTEAQRMLDERNREANKMRELLKDARNGVEDRVKEVKLRLIKVEEERDKMEEQIEEVENRRRKEVESMKKRCEQAEQEVRSGKLECEKMTQEFEERRKQWDELTKENFEKYTREIDERKAQVISLEKELQNAHNRIEQLRGVTTHDKDKSRQLGSKETIDTKSIAGLEGCSNEGNQAGDKLGINRMENTVLQKGVGHKGRECIENGMKDRTEELLTQSEYIKNVILQFLEQKDRKLQQQLLPVIAKMLNMTEMEEQRWINLTVKK